MLFWFGLSLAFAALFASYALGQAFSSQYVAQDDVRQHVFWMRRFVDAELFPRDLIADYFQSVAPLGYSALYRVMAILGLDPLLLSKLLPMALGLVTTGYCFGVCLQILPVPGAAFFATLILNQSLWMQDDLVSATPRAFLYPLFLAFLFYLLRGSLRACLLVIALQGLFYPSTMFISAGVLILRLVCWQNGGLRLSRVRRDYLFCAAGLGVILLALLFYAMKISGFGPIITAGQARALPEFWPGGRAHFFGHDFWRFWVTGNRSGLVEESLLEDVPIYCGLLLPILFYYPRHFPLVQKITNKVTVLSRIVLASLFMFFAAHALLFKLHHPNRYTAHTLRVVLAIAAGIALTVITDAILEWADRGRFYPLLRRLLAWATISVIVALLVWFPSSLGNFPNSKYRVGHTPSLYEFFSRQPKDALIATLAQEAKNIPIFSNRSVLVAREYSLPYHTQYYSEMRQRASDLINAHYSPNLIEAQDFIRKYKVTFLLIERNAFTPEYVNRDSWIMQYQPAATEAIERLKQGAVPAITTLISSCSVFENEDYVVLDAECMLKALPE